jgi:chromosome segregation protein
MLVGGSAEIGGSGVLAKKKEVKDLAEKISGLEASLRRAKEKQKQLETETVALETALQKARESQTQGTQQQIQVEKELYRLQEQLKHSGRHLEILALETQQIEGDQTDVEQELSSHQNVLSEVAEEIQAVESAVAQANEKMKQASKDVEVANQGAMALKLELTNLQAQYDNCQNTLRRLRSFQSDSVKKLSQFKAELKQKQEARRATENGLEKDRAELRQLYGKLKTVEETLAEGEATYLGIEDMLRENDQALGEMRTAQQETLQKIQQLELKQSERRMRRDHLVSRIQETYHRSIDTSHEDYHAEDFSAEEAEKQLAHCRERMSRIGEVNLMAIQEYEDLRERYQLLTSQRDDLMGAIEALHRVIRKINRTSLKQFMKTFRVANEKLQMVFPRLFEGGTARLALMEPKRPLESGVSYLVHPPGKKLTRMSLLSGGEKALSAIALVFSLFFIKPAAFCVLDEIDAPLDEANIARFSHLLKEIGVNSQVIMVTHNKRSMEMADGLFGVTMEHKGISKLLSISLTQ